WWSPEKVEPPTVDPASAEPEVLAAIEAAREQVRRSPGSPAAWGQLGQVLLAHYYTDEANLCFTRAEVLEPNEARWAYLHGLTRMDSDTTEAITHWQRAVQLRGDVPAMRLRLAEALLRQGRLAAPPDQYRRLPPLDPD